MVLLGWVSRLYVSKEPVRSKVATSSEEDMERNEDWRLLVLEMMPLRRALVAAVDDDDDEATADAADLLRSIDPALLVANIML